MSQLDTELPVVCGWIGRAFATRARPGVPFKILRFHQILDAPHVVEFVDGGTVVGLLELREKVRVHVGGTEHPRLLMLGVDPLRVKAGGGCDL